jgi:hypothetical protein
MLICSYCGKEIDQGQGFVAEEDENGNIVKAYHPICNALANKLDLTMWDEFGNIILQITQGEIVIDNRPKEEG